MLMASGLQSPVQMIKGVGPQRAELLAKRGIHTLEDLLGYLPFRYEDRIKFSQIKDLRRNATYPLRGNVASGQAVRTRRGRDAIYHLLVQDETGSLACKFFHGGYLEGRLKPGQQLILHGKAEVDKQRPARIEMVNPQMEVISGEGLDSTEVGRIVPIYEAVGTFGTRAIRRAIYGALQHLDPRMPDVLPSALRTKLQFPTHREAVIQTHFPPADESLDALNQFRSIAQRRLIFEELFLYQLSLALARRATRKENAIAFRVREDNVREALKRILPFKPTAAQKSVLAEILAVQHFLSARRIQEKAGHKVELLISGIKFAEKSAALERIASGEAQLVIGTHALIEDNLVFKRLGFVAIDEQHRFGVLQRKRLMDKAASHGHAPHVLVLTATPIP